MTRCNSTDGPSTNETLINPTLVGTITLDLTAATTMAEQLCAPLNDCIVTAVRHLLEDECESLKVANLEVSTSIDLADRVQVQLLEMLLPKLQPYLEDALKGATIESATIADSLIRNCTFDLDSLSHVYDYMVKEQIATAFYAKTCDYLRNCIISHVSNGTFNGVKIAGGVFTDARVTGGTFAQNYFEDNTFKTNTFTGEMMFNPVANASLCTAIETCVMEWINAAFAELDAKLDAEIARSTAKDADQDSKLAIIDGRLGVLEHCQPADFLDCEGDSVKCQPIITEKCLNNYMANLQTCTGVLQEATLNCPGATCLQPVVTCKELEDAMAGQPSCTGTVNNMPVIRCDELPALLEDLVKTCSGGPMGKQRMSSCADTASAISAQPACDGGPLNGRKVVTEACLQAAIDAQSACNFVAPQQGNLITCVGGKLYYGVIAEQGAYYVDAINGNDNASGYRNAPMRTLFAAASRVPEGSTNVVIHLYENQNHVVYSSAPVLHGRVASIQIRTYGPTCDAIRATWNESATGWQADAYRNWPRANIVCVADGTLSSLPGQVHAVCFGRSGSFGGGGGAQIVFTGVTIWYPTATNNNVPPEWRSLVWIDSSALFVDCVIHNDSSRWFLVTASQYRKNYTSVTNVQLSNMVNSLFATDPTRDMHVNFGISRSPAELSVGGLSYLVGTDIYAIPDKMMSLGGGVAVYTGNITYN